MCHYKLPFHRSIKKAVLISKPTTCLIKESFFRKFCRFCDRQNLSSPYRLVRSLLDIKSCRYYEATNRIKPMLILNNSLSLCQLWSPCQNMDAGLLIEGLCQLASDKVFEQLPCNPCHVNQSKVCLPLDSCLTQHTGKVASSMKHINQKADVYN